MKPLVMVLLVASLACAGCTGKKVRLPDYSDKATITRIKVASDGTIYMNGAPASLEELNKNFEQLKANNGSVRYYRESPEGDPPEQAMKVIQAVVDANLRIRLCATEEEMSGTK